MLAGSAPSSPAALAAAAEARALAWMGDRKAACIALAEAEQIFARMRGMSQDDLAFVFTEKRTELLPHRHPDRARRRLPAPEPRTRLGVPDDRPGADPARPGHPPGPPRRLRGGLPPGRPGAQPGPGRTPDLHRHHPGQGAAERGRSPAPRRPQPEPGPVGVVPPAGHMSTSHATITHLARATTARPLADEAFTVLRAVCDRIGVDASGARLMRLRSNAVFKLRGDMVVRIATAPDAPDPPAGRAGGGPLAGRPGVPDGPSGRRDPPPADRARRPGGHLLAVRPLQRLPDHHRARPRARDLHREPVPTSIPLRRLNDPLAEVRHAVEHRPRCSPLISGAGSATGSRSSPTSGTISTPDRPSCSTATPGSTTCSAAATAMRFFAIGTAWPWVPVNGIWSTPTTGSAASGLSAGDVDAFAHAYGSDLRDWPRPLTSMEIRDMHAVGIHIRNALGDPFSRQELPRRLRLADQRRWPREVVHGCSCPRGAIGLTCCSGVL